MFMKWDEDVWNIHIVDSHLNIVELPCRETTVLPTELSGRPIEQPQIIKYLFLVLVLLYQISSVEVII